MATKKKSEEGPKPKWSAADLSSTRSPEHRYLAGGRSPAERAAKYQGSRVSRGVNTVPLKPERLAKLKEQEAMLHASLTSDAGRSATRAVHESAGVTSPAMQPKPRAPKLSQGQVRGETFSIPPKSGKPKVAAAKPAAPQGKVVDQVADSKARRKAAATKAASKAGRTTGTRYLPGTKEYAMVRSDKQSTGAGGPEEAKIAALAKPKTTAAVSAPSAKPKRTRKPALSKMAPPNAADRVTGIPAPEGVVHKAENIVTTRHGAKAPETDHIQPQQYFGKHVKVHDLASVTKNARGSVDAPSIGRHSAERVGRGRHAGGYNEAYDAHRTALVGSVAYGRHARSM